MSSTANKAVVVGLGKTGLSAARYLHANGWQVAVTDSRAAPPELPALRAQLPDVAVYCGALRNELVRDAAMVVASPGLSLQLPIFAAARAAGCQILGDVELFARAVTTPVVGITGTNGKSTVTTLLGQMALRAGLRVAMGGNLGTPALDLLGDTTVQLHVLELSSFQLESVHSLKLAAATVLNVTPDHMDRYVSADDYVAAKRRIFANAAIAVLNVDDERVAAMARAGQRTLTFSIRLGHSADFHLLQRERGECWLANSGTPLLNVALMKISGLHNAANALAALALGTAIDLPAASMLETLKEFPGLPHRAQWVAEKRGVRFVNDSKGTNVGATLAAVAGFFGPLIVIAGGDGKGQDFRPLATAFRGKVRHTILIGRDAAAIELALEGVCATERCTSLETAVSAAARVARAGDTVLLSPACASLDMFRDYAHRGMVYSAAVAELAA